MQRGRQALDEFMEFVGRRYGNAIRAWFLMDPEENMKLGEKQFLRSCEEIGFRGDASAMWKFLTGDSMGSVSILEIDPVSAMLLSSLKLFVDKVFDGDASQAFFHLDEHRSGRITRADFGPRLRALGFGGPAGRLFQLLDRHGLGFVGYGDLDFLSRWWPPLFIFSQPNHAGVERLKERMLQVQGSLLRAWRRLLDPEGSMRVTWDRFRTACVELSRESWEGMPKTVGEVAEIWRSLDEGCSGWLALSEFDVPSFQALAEYKRWADRNHGGVIRAFRKLDDSINAKLSQNEMKEAAKGPDGCTADLDVIFNGLDRYNHSYLAESDMKFLDDWDPDWEEWAVAAKHRNHL